MKDEKTFGEGGNKDSGDIKENENKNKEEIDVLKDTNAIETINIEAPKKEEEIKIDQEKVEKKDSPITTENINLEIKESDLKNENNIEEKKDNIEKDKIEEEKKQDNVNKKEENKEKELIKDGEIKLDIQVLPQDGKNEHTDNNNINNEQPKIEPKEETLEKPEKEKDEEIKVIINEENDKDKKQEEKIDIEILEKIKEPEIKDESKPTIEGALNLIDNGSDNIKITEEKKNRRRNKYSKRKR